VDKFLLSDIDNIQQVTTLLSPIDNVLGPMSRFSTS
jgi:hypothetical protein